MTTIEKGMISQTMINIQLKQEAPCCSDNNERVVKVKSKFYIMYFNPC